MESIYYQIEDLPAQRKELTAKRLSELYLPLLWGDWEAISNKIELWSKEDFDDSGSCEFPPGITIKDVRRIFES